MKEKTPKARSLTEPKKFSRVWREDPPKIEYRYVTSDGAQYMELERAVSAQRILVEKTCERILAMERDERGLLLKFFHKLLDRK